MEVSMSMRKIPIFVLGVAVMIGGVMTGGAGVLHAQPSSRDSQARADAKANKRQKKAQKKYAKAQKKAEKKMLKMERKNTHYPKQAF
jgi:hypothetical protein